MIVLGIETSCDETAAAIVTDRQEILANVLFSQIATHQKFGGVVPEVGARAHLDYLPPIIRETLHMANLSLDQLDGIAATCGPGLIGGVIVGSMMAKAIAAFHQKPFIAVNHLEAHALTVRLTNTVEFPYLLLLVSGGHCQLLQVNGVGDYIELGATLDDAVGESFDKVARMLGFPYPGGPEIEKAARLGNPTRFDFPRPLLNQETLNFSFSGLKTAVRYALEKISILTDQDRYDIAASFQQAVIEVLVARSLQAAEICSDLKRFVIAGGVASNQKIRSYIEEVLTKKGVEFFVSNPALCTDNGAMVAWAGLEYLRLGKQNSLDFDPRPRWPLKDLRP
jgi:N6-L-threonylcarbamoyladenine synthase